MSDENFAYPDPNALVYNVQLPYWGGIPGGVHVGKLIEVKGSMPYGADAFEVNLVTGLDPIADRALHVSVRFSTRIVVRNIMERNQWGSEERGGRFPFTSGRDFSMLILVDQNAYRISVDGQHCWEFAHRIPFSRVNTIFISGSVNVERIEFVNKVTPYQPGICIPAPPVGLPGVYPATGALIPGSIPGTCYPPSGPNIDNYPLPGQGLGPCVTLPRQTGGYVPSGGIQPSSNLAPVYNPSIPYAYPIYGGLKPGMMVYISGRPSASAYRFRFNFQCGTSPYPPPDIALHFDARLFNKTVVRNSFLNNAWGNEEVQAPFFPFQHGVNFDMIIRIESDRYMVALNGQHFVEYKYRMWPLSRIDTLSIEDDIVVSSIRFA